MIVDEIIEIRDEITRIQKEEKCTCSSFFLQYEGYCACKKGVMLEEAKTKLHNLIQSL